MLAPRFLAFLICMSSPVSAQSVSGRALAWFDVGGARVRQPTSSPRAAASLGGGVWYGRDRVAIAGEANVTVARDSISAAQYVVRTTLLPSRWLRTDVDVSATTNGIVLPGRTGNRAASMRHTVSIQSFELFGAYGAGRSERPQLTRSGRAYTAGAEWQHRATRDVWRAGLSAQRSYSNDYQLLETSGIVLGQIADRYTLNDVVAQLSWQRDKLWLQASRGWRRGADETVGRAQSLNLSAAIAVNRSTTFIVQTGEQLADVVRGVPQARYTGVALRWTPLRPSSVRNTTRARTDARAVPGVDVVVVPDVRGDEVLVQRGVGRGTITVTVAAPANAVVELATSASDWAPLRVVHNGQAFVQLLTLPSGTHRISVRVNGGAWRAPRGLAAVNDDFGGKAGVVVIP